MNYQEFVQLEVEGYVAIHIRPKPVISILGAGVKLQQEEERQLRAEQGFRAVGCIQREVGKLAE